MLEGKTEDTRSIAESTGVHPFLLLPLVLATGVAVFKWRFPCTTIETLIKEDASVQKLLAEAWQEDLLGEKERQFREAWKGYHDDIENIKLNFIQVPDSRAHPLAWIRFRWRHLRDIDVCYTGLQNLSASITLKTETEKRNRQYFIPVDASSSGIYTPNTAGSFQITANLGSAE